MSYEEAYSLVRYILLSSTTLSYEHTSKARPFIAPNSGFVIQLKTFAEAHKKRLSSASGMHLASDMDEISNS